MGQRTSYVTGNKEERKEQIEKDLDNMTWDSPERPAYDELVTTQVIVRFRQKHKEKRGQVINDAYHEPDRKDFANDKTYQTALEKKAKNREYLQSMKAEGVTHAQALDYVTAYHRRDDNTQYKGNKESGTWKDAYRTAITALDKLYGDTLLP